MKLLSTTNKRSDFFLKNKIQTKEEEKEKKRNQAETKIIGNKLFIPRKKRVAWQNN